MRFDQSDARIARSAVDVIFWEVKDWYFKRSSAS